MTDPIEGNATPAAKLVVWVVRFSNYEPAEVASIHATCAGAEEEAKLLAGDAPWPAPPREVWRVEPWEVKP